jgi:hypothetical protein
MIIYLREAIKEIYELFKNLAMNTPISRENIRSGFLANIKYSEKNIYFNKRRIGAKQQPLFSNDSEQIPVNVNLQ